jgi:SAM-dependent methyltransferase
VKPPAKVCRVCSGKDFARELSVPEMMFGLRDVFPYGLCAACGSLSLLSPPEEMGKYYPPNYYSFAPLPARSWKARLVAGCSRQLPDRLLSLAARMTGSYGLEQAAKVRQRAHGWLGGGRRRPRRLVDIGCGAGERLQDYYAAGLAVEGADPYFKGDNPREFPIHRTGIEKLDSTYDIVTFHDSLEHMPEPGAVLRHALRLLAPGGVCVVAIPKLPSLAFDRYGEHWFPLDAPRHFFVPSVDGLTALARSIGFRRVGVEHDETAKDLLWSEAYRRGIPREGSNLRAFLSEAEQAGLTAPVAEARRAGRSCHAVFILSQ